MDAGAVSDLDEVPPAAAARAGEDDPPGSCGADRSALRRGEVDPGMEPVAARAEDVADGRDQRSCKADRAAGERPAQSSDRGRPSDPVRPDPGPLLETTKRGVRV